jgi:hypothetical protein
VAGVVYDWPYILLVTIVITVLLVALVLTL